MHHVTSCKATVCKVYACLAVTCHLHFWQNDRDLLRATAVTRGWNGYRNKVITNRRKFSRRSRRDSNPRPFNHESGALTTELSPLPQYALEHEGNQQTNSCQMVCLCCSLGCLSHVPSGLVSEELGTGLLAWPAVVECNHLCGDCIFDV